MQSGSNRRDFLTQAVTLAGAGAIAAAEGAETNAAATPPTDKPGRGVRARKKSRPDDIDLAPPDRQPPNLEVPKPVARKIGWAIVGLGELALQEVLPAFGECKYSKPVALVSGHPDKARQVAKVYGISESAIYGYDDYDRIAENKEVDVIYIILPNNMHADFTVRGLRAGKHVLCEKPMATSVEEAKQMVAAAKEAERKLMIGYRLHYEPYNQKVMEMCRDKTLGEIKTFSSCNAQNVKAPNIRLSAELGGGPLGDVGIYSINAARYVINEEPEEVTATVYQPEDDPRFREVAESMAFTLRYPSGVLAHCDCSFGSAESRFFRVNCANGYIHMDSAFSYRGQRLKIQQGPSRKDEVQVSDVVIEPVNHFAAEMDHFSTCILENRDPRTPGEMGLADMRIIAALEKAAKDGQWVRLEA